MDHRNEVKTRELANQTYHKEILCFSSTEFQCGHQDVGHSDSQKYEDHVEEYQQVVPLVSPTWHYFLLHPLSFHEVGTCIVRQLDIRREKIKMHMPILLGQIAN